MRIIPVLLVCIASVLAACSEDGDTDPGDWRARCGLPADYDLLQVPPHPCLLSDPEFGLAFRAAVQATNVAKGPCHDASFSVVGDDGTDRVYRDGDPLVITLEYDAPGCADARLTFGGFHINGSPWARHYCNPEGCSRGGFGSNIYAETIAITEPAGRLTFTGKPGTFPPIDIGSPPNLEGFQLCSIVVGFSDGRFDGSHTGEQLDLDSDACSTAGQ